MTVVNFQSIRGNVMQTLCGCQVAREINEKMRTVRAEPSESFHIGEVLVIARRSFQSFLLNDLFCSNTCELGCFHDSNPCQDEGYICIAFVVATTMTDQVVLNPFVG